MESRQKNIRRKIRKEKTKIVNQFMTENWDKVIISSVNMIRRFNFKNRFSVAMTILFKPDKVNKKKEARKRVAAAG